MPEQTIEEPPDRACPDTTGGRIRDRHQLPPVRPFSGLGTEELLPQPATGIDRDGWHAIGSVFPPEPNNGAQWGLALCGHALQVTTRRGPFDPGEHSEDSVCLACLWWYAIRSDTVEAQVARLATEPGRDLAIAITRAVLDAADEPGGDNELDHPVTGDLLAAVTAHAGTTLVHEACTEDECDHDPASCPSTVGACRACSVQAGGWAGEWQGTYRAEATVIGPCSLLRAMADHYSITA